MMVTTWPLLAEAAEHTDGSASSSAEGNGPHKAGGAGAVFGAACSCRLVCPVGTYSLDWGSALKLTQRQHR